MLVCSGVRKQFGGVTALEDVDLSLEAGQVTGLIGPNGSGKSTLVNIISGFLTADRGTITLEDEAISGLSPRQARQQGLTRTFQNLRLCSALTVLDNMLIGLHPLYAGRHDVYGRWLPHLLGTPRARQVDRDARDLALGALDRVGLAGKASIRVRGLTYGEQKRLELARATVLPTRVLLLDEPTAGLAPDEAAALMKLIAAPFTGSSDRCLLLIEHRLDLVLDLCSSVVVLNSGQVIAAGPPEDIARDPEVRRVYIGGEA